MNPQQLAHQQLAVILQWLQLAQIFFKLLFLIVCLLLTKLVCTKGFHLC